MHFIEETIGIGLIALLLLMLVGLTQFIPWVCTVSRVVDGDSLEIIRRGRMIRVRLRAMDAPEWTQPGGREAAKQLRGLVDGSKVLVAPVAVDKYGRHVCHVMTVHGPASLRMIASGHAWARTVAGRIPEISARIAGRGLWAQAGAVDPKNWRQSRPSRSGR